MKKLFISCPMKGRTEENIKESMQFLHKYAELMTGEELEPIDTWISEEPINDVDARIWYLGESIKRMANADYVVGISYCDGMWTGCEIERRVAQDYDIPFLECEWHRAKVFSDCVNLERKRYDDWSTPVKCTAAVKDDLK